MNFDFLKTFTKKADDQKARLSDTFDTEVSDMERLITAAYGNDGIAISDRLPDDSETAVKAAVLAAMQIDVNSPELRARMAEASPDLGL